jgi:hypothetical protein
MIKTVLRVECTQELSSSSCIDGKKEVWVYKILNAFVAEDTFWEKGKV